MESSYCKVCVVEFGQSCVVVATKCGHVFHKDCALLHFSTIKRKQCPDCKFPLENHPLDRIYLDFADKEVMRNALVNELKEKIAAAKMNLKNLKVKAREDQAKIDRDLQIIQAENKLIKSNVLAMKEQRRQALSKKESLVFAVKFQKFFSNNK